MRSLSVDEPFDGNKIGVGKLGAECTEDIDGYRLDRGQKAEGRNVFATLELPAKWGS